MVSTLIEIAFRCLKHYLHNVISQHGVYMEDKMAGSNYDGFRYINLPRVT